MTFTQFKFEISYRTPDGTSQDMYRENTQKRKIFIKSLLRTSSLRLLSIVYDIIKPVRLRRIVTSSRYEI